MMEKTIEHAARKISFSVDELKPWTKQDEQLIKTYIQLHDNEILHREHAKELLECCSSLNKQTKSVRAELVPVKDMIAALSKLADDFVIVDPNKKQKALAIVRETEKTNTCMQNYQELLQKLEPVVQVCDEKNVAFIDAVENLDLWNTYSKIKHRHFKNYEINAIDIVSFDNDDDRFRGYVSVYSKKHSDIIDYANSAIDDYNKLLLETEMQYAIWKEFLKRLALIRSVSDSSGETYISAN